MSRATAELLSAMGTAGPVVDGTVDIVFRGVSDAVASLRDLT